VWLCANNRVDEAERIIRNAARLNSISMPENILVGRSSEVDETGGGGGGGEGSRVDDDAEAKDTSKKNGGNPFVKFTNLARLRRAKKKDDENPTAARYTLLDVFRNRRLAFYCVCMAFLWSEPPATFRLSCRCLVSSKVPVVSRVKLTHFPNLLVL